jgi:hypothetical protein
MAEGGGEQQGWGQSIADVMADIIGSTGGYRPQGWNSFTHANTPLDLISKPGLFMDMFKDRTISLPDSEKMRQDILNAMDTDKVPFGFIKGMPSNYANWGFTEKEAQRFENQINNIDMTNWDANVNLTSNPASTDVNPYGALSVNPHQDTFTYSEQTGAGWKPANPNDSFLNQLIDTIGHNILGKKSGKTTFGFGVPMAVPAPAPAESEPHRPEHDTTSSYFFTEEAKGKRAASSKRAVAAKKAASKSGGRSKSKGRTTAAPASGPHGGGMTSAESAAAGRYGSDPEGEFGGTGGYGGGMGGGLWT